MTKQTGTTSPVSRQQSADLIARINHALCKVIGSGASIRNIAESLPETPLGNDDAFCSELVFAPLANGVIEHANTAMSLTGELECLLRETGGVQ